MSADAYTRFPLTSNPSRLNGAVMQEVHVVLDSYSSHTTTLERYWLAKPPAITFILLRYKLLDRTSVAAIPPNSIQDAIAHFTRLQTANDL